MAIFLVGPDDSRLFSKRKTWDFDDALEAANNGDTIELVKGFTPYYEPQMTDKIHRIKKSITILGYIQENEDGILYTNVLNQIFIEKGAHVTLKNICLKNNMEKRNLLNIKGNSHVIIENALIENECTSGENYPTVHISENSNVSFNNVTIKPSSNLDGKNKVQVNNSTLTATRCTINTGVFGISADLRLDDTLISNTDSNGLFADNQSTVHLNSVKIKGGKKTEDTTWPCVKLVGSKGVFEKVTIEQELYDRALHLVDVNITINDSRIDSFKSSNSKVNIKQTQFVESFSAEEKTIVESNCIDILGKENGKINLFANSNSSIYANTINFGQLSTPNIKLENNVNFNVDQIRFLSFDESKVDFKRDVNGNSIILDKEVNIEYFGEKSASQRLDKLIGIQSVKEEVEAFIAVVQMNMLRKEKGLKSSDLTLHSLFLGNPGTGKTTVARIIGEMLYEKNVTTKDTFIEVSRSDLVGQYVGDTAVKTRDILKSALGGVLFIDEAYTLAMGGENDYGLEAINEILSFMENHRTDIVIIFAGYTDDMNEFLKTNAGLKSRIPNVFDFPDYTVDEIIKIGLIELHKEDYEINEDTYRELVSNNFENSYDFSNGRWIRNLNDNIIKKLAIRVMRTKNPDATSVLDEDLYSLMM